MEFRGDYDLIATLVDPGSRVLDLGCGDGELLRRLVDFKGCSGTGVEIENDQFLQALSRGVNVIDLDLNTQLSEFTDDSYDVVILSRTLQNVEQPRDVLEHIARIAERGIVSMPNFALWRNRLELLRGRMPISKDLPFEWYDTPNLHYTSLHDLEPLFTELGFVIEKKIALSARGKPMRWRSRFANLLAGSAIYLLRTQR